MKKIIIAMAAIAAAFTMASCSKEQPVSPNENPTVGKSVITATIENDATKTALTPDKDGYKVVWSEGDKIYVGDYDYEYWEAEYTLDKSSAGSSKGAFIWQKGDYINSICEEYEEPVFEEGEKYVAVHPFDLVDENNNEYLIWKTEQTYNATERYIPMYAEAECTKDGEADFIFANLGGLLQLTVYGSATISSIKISAAEKEGMSGAFNLGHDVNGVLTGQIMYGSENTVNYITLDCGEGGVELSRDGTDFYISMPCHYTIKGVDMIIDGYPGVTITLTDMEGRTCEKRLNNEKGLVIERSKITTAKFTASEFKAPVPEGALPGKFTVNASGKQVYFSQGNLTATIDETGAPTAWKFAANQYDYLGEGGANKTIGTAAGDIDLFGWSNSAIIYGISTSMESLDYSGDFVDWGNAIDNKGTWRTLTADEWLYLFSTRDASTVSGGTNARYAKATVKGNNGVILLPDTYIHPSDVTGLKNVNLANAEFNENSFDLSAWQKIESAGAVFLSAAGRRAGFVVKDFGNYGTYWSSSLFDYEEPDDLILASCVYFHKTLFEPGERSTCCYGYSVRLVTDVK